MPELPEVENIRKHFESTKIEGTSIRGVQFFRKDIRFPLPMKNISKIYGEKILSIQRRAKYLLIQTERHLLLSHLGMTGTWRFLEGERRKHDHVQIDLSDGRSLIYNDPRRFGFLLIFAQGEKNPYLDKLGLEPLSDEFNAEYLFKKTRKKTASIKSLIMDQAVVVGVGNIYAAESLFLAKIRPQRKAMSITRDECVILVKEIKNILERAIAKGGSSISDFYRLDGSRGDFQNEFLVYDRSGEPCKKCGSKLKNIKISGRASVYCQSCQK